MATIIPHTSRAAGTVLTASIYNSDHLVHITNANALNAEINLQHAIAIGLVIDGGSTETQRFTPSPGIYGDLPVPFDCEIIGAFAVADQAGDAVIDLLYDSLDNFPPGDDDSIVGATPIELDGTQTYSDNALTDWTRELREGGVVRVKLVSASTVTRITVWISVIKTSLS